MTIDYDSWMNTRVDIGTYNPRDFDNLTTEMSSFEEGAMNQLTGYKKKPKKILIVGKTKGLEDQF